MVTIPYMRRVSGAVEQTLRRHEIPTAVRTCKTIRQCLVDPKDNKTDQESAGVVYSIPCKYCPMVYIGEMGRRFEVRHKGHKNDVKQLEGVKYQGWEKGSSLSQRSTSEC